MSPLPLFIIATAVLAAFSFYILLVGLLRTPTVARRPIALRQRRAEAQIAWDRAQAPGIDGGA